MKRIETIDELIMHYKIKPEDIVYKGENAAGVYVKCFDGLLYMALHDDSGPWPYDTQEPVIPYCGENHIAVRWKAVEKDFDNPRVQLRMGINALLVQYHARTKQKVREVHVEWANRASGPEPEELMILVEGNF
jgi:hypothetical protein